MGTGSSGLAKKSGGGPAKIPTANDILSFDPLASDRGTFQVEALGGTATLTGYIDKKNQIGYDQTGSSQWRAFDLVSGRQFASTFGAGSFTNILTRAAANLDQLKRMRSSR